MKILATVFFVLFASLGICGIGNGNTPPEYSGMDEYGRELPTNTTLATPTPSIYPFAVPGMEASQGTDSIVFYHAKDLDSVVYAGTDTDLQIGEDKFFPYNQKPCGVGYTCLVRLNGMGMATSQNLTNAKTVLATARMALTEKSGVVGGNDSIVADCSYSERASTFKVSCTVTNR